MYKIIRKSRSLQKKIAIMTTKKQYIIKIIFLFSLLLFSNPLIAQYTIKGKIITTDNVDVSSLPVVLLQFNQEQQPPMFPIQRSQTNSRGEYSFFNIQPIKNSLYLIGTLINGQRLSSEMIQLKDKTIETLNINLDVVSYDIEMLIFERKAIVFSDSSEGVIVTEILEITNPTKKTITNSNNPTQINIPSEAIDIQMFSEQAVLQRVGKSFLLEYRVPSGKQKIIYEYFIPFQNRKYSYNYTSSLFFLKLQLFYPVDELYIVFPERIVPLEQQVFSNRTYNIASIQLKKEEMLEFIVEKTRIPRSYLFILSGFFSVLCLVSLGVFLYRKVRK